VTPRSISSIRLSDQTYENCGDPLEVELEQRDQINIAGLDEYEDFDDERDTDDARYLRSRESVRSATYYAKIGTLRARHG
jgi:hypothetical protein